MKQTRFLTCPIHICMCVSLSQLFLIMFQFCLYFQISILHAFQMSWKGRQLSPRSVLNYCTFLEQCIIHSVVSACNIPAGPCSLSISQVQQHAQVCKYLNRRLFYIFKNRYKLMLVDRCCLQSRSYHNIETFMWDYIKRSVWLGEKIKNIYVCVLLCSYFFKYCNLPFGNDVIFFPVSFSLLCLRHYLYR